MEAAHLEIDGYAENLIGESHTLANPSIPPAQAENFGSPRFAHVPESSAKKSTSKVDNQASLEKNTRPSVSNCYVFKSRLQEYAQKAGVLPPVYETIKEGPSHEPSFRSTVILDNVRYDSLPGFFNRKAAEQSAAEVALVELSKSVDIKFGISQPVHETGLCKNLLQEYAQKMNYAIPLYECHKDNAKQGKASTYSCVLEIGGIKYIGASASTKKEAEIKVAKTALLAIQSSTSVSENHGENSNNYTVVPQKKATDTSETAAALKTKKGRFKKQHRNNWKRGARWGKKGGQSKKDDDGMEVNVNGQIGVETGSNDVTGPHWDMGDCLDSKTDNIISCEESDVIGTHRDAGDYLEVKTDNLVSCEEPYVIGICRDAGDCLDGKMDNFMSYKEPDVIGCHHDTADRLEVKSDDFVSFKELDVLGSHHNTGVHLEVKTDNVVSFKEPDVLGSHYNNTAVHLEVKTDNLVSFQESDVLNSDHNTADCLEVKTDHNMDGVLNVKTDNFVNFQEPGSGLVPMDSTTSNSCDARFCNLTFENGSVSFDKGRCEDGGECTAMNVHP